MAPAMSVQRIVSVEEQEEKRTLHCHEEELCRLLLSEEVADLPVVVLSVAGAYRTGKSFLLNSMIRYLTAPDKAHWLENEYQSFEWKSGAEPDTKGLIMSKPIRITLPSGGQGALVLLDTEGLFDTTSTISASKAMFTLSALISSVQVINVMNDLKASDLGWFELFAQIGHAISGTPGGGWSFQDLLLLIRDWVHKQDYPIGSSGGKRLVEARLNSSRQDIDKHREQFKACYTDVRGFLLPHPGKVVAESSEFTGDATDMDPEFIEGLTELMETLFKPGKLPVKRNGDGEMTCAQLAQFIITCVNSLKHSDTPLGAESILDAYSKASNTSAIEEEKRGYVKRMEELSWDDTTLLDSPQLEEKHQEAKGAALKSFDERRVPMSPGKSKEQYRSQLEDQLDDWLSARRSGARAMQLVIAECSAKYDQLLHTRSKWNPLRYTSSYRSTLEDRDIEAARKAMEHFGHGTKLYLDKGSAKRTGESKKKLEEELRERLLQALKTNKTIHICLLVGGAVCIIAGGAVTASWAVPATFEIVASAVGEAVAINIVTTGQVLVSIITGIDAGAIGTAAISVLISTQRSKQQAIDKQQQAPVPPPRVSPAASARVLVLRVAAARRECPGRIGRAAETLDCAAASSVDGCSGVC